MRYLYTVLYYLALPFFLLRLLWRSRRNPEYRRRWSERFGYAPFTLERAIWVHAVSLGESIAAVPLIQALKATYPNIPMLVTTTTITGSARVKAVFGESVYHSYLPYDTPFAIARFLKRVKPATLIVMETELWPNLFAACEQRKIPVMIANGRLSERSAVGYKRVAPVTRGMFKAIQILAAQAQQDADRFIALGMPKDRVRVTGSLKFDLKLPEDLQAKSKILRAQLGVDRPVWIAASTHHSEDEIILAAHTLIIEQQPNALLILVPRHPERFDAVEALVKHSGFDVVRRSAALPSAGNVSVYLGDTMGELLSLYAVSDVAFVAGSFAPIGGHNILEPAALVKPIVTGPHLFNFAEISQMLLKAKGMAVVQDAKTLAAEVLHLFQDNIYRENMGQNAYRVVEANRGALSKQVELAESLVGV